MKYDHLGARYRDCLLDAGWYNGRRANLDEAQTLLAQHQIPLLPSAADFLSDFLGLTIPSGVWLFDVASAVNGIGADGVRDMSYVLRRSLCPVGWGMSAAVLISAADEFVIIEDQWIGFSVFPSRTAFLLSIMGCEDAPSQGFVFDESDGSVIPHNPTRPARHRGGEPLYGLRSQETK